MDIKCNINGIDVILEGEELEKFLIQKQKDIEEGEAETLALEEKQQKRQQIFEKLGLTPEEIEIFLG